MSSVRLVFAAGGRLLALERTAIEAVRERGLLTRLPGTGGPVRGLAVVDGAVRLVVQAAALLDPLPADGAAARPADVSDMPSMWVLLAPPAGGLVLEVPAPVAFTSPGPRACRPADLAGLCHRSESDGRGGVLSVVSPSRLLAAMRRADPSAGRRLRSRPGREPARRVHLPRHIPVPLEDLDALLTALVELESRAAGPAAGADVPAGTVAHLRRRVERLRRSPFRLLQPALERGLLAAWADGAGPAVLETAGGATCLDRDVLAALADVLPSLVRHAAGRGREATDDRRRPDRPAIPCIRVAADTRGRLVSVRVTTDAGRPGAAAPEPDPVLDAAREGLLGVGGSLRAVTPAEGGWAAEVTLPAGPAVTRCLVVRLGDLHAGIPAATVQGLTADGEGVRLTLAGSDGRSLSLAVDQVLGRLETAVRPLPAGGLGLAALGTAVWESRLPVVVLEPAALARLAAAAGRRVGAGAAAAPGPETTATDAGPAAG